MNTREPADRNNARPDLVRWDKVFPGAAFIRIPMGNFEDLYRQHVQAVFRFAYRVTGDRETAEDVTSEAFMALYRNRESIDESRLPGWLLTVARNRARDLWRRRALEQRYIDQLEGPVAQPIALEAWLLECADLKPIHRTCVMLRYGYGMTRAEIASRTGLSETQVKGYLQYGLKLLREAYGKSGTK